MLITFFLSFKNIIVRNFIEKNIYGHIKLIPALL